MVFITSGIGGNGTGASQYEGSKELNILIVGVTMPFSYEVQRMRNS